MNSYFNWPENIKESDKHVFSKDNVKKEEIPYQLYIINRSIVTRRGIFRNFLIPTKIGFPGAELLGIIHWRYYNPLLMISRFLAYYARFLLSPFARVKAMPTVKDEKYVMVCDQWSDYYFHWFTDALPRLFRLIDNSSMKQNEITLVLPDNHNMTFIKKSLDMLGFRYQYLSKGINHYFSKLYIPSHCGRPGFFNYSLEATRVALQKAASTHMRPPTGKKLYISRARARCRLITNEEEVTALLQEFGFEVVHLEEYPWERQLEIVSEASVILGPHGAGFTHMYYLKTGSSVVELRVADTDDHNNCLFNMANSLGHHYYYLLCDRKGVFNIPGDDNLTVDTNELRKLLLDLTSQPAMQTI